MEDQQNKDLLSIPGLAVLGVLSGALFIAAGQANDQKHLVGFDAQRSLVAHCLPGKAAVFTNGERQAVFFERPNGRVAAQPIFRDPAISRLQCDAVKGEVIVTTARGEERLALAQVRSASHTLAMMP